MLHRYSILLGILALAAVACSDDSPPIRAGYELSEIRRYGALEEAQVDPTEASAKASGPVLARIADVAADSLGHIFVLDQGWKKIVEFEHDASLKRVILGGDGDGPGEFRLPVKLHLAPDGSFSVLDYELNRITWFDDGTPSRVQRLEGHGFLSHAVLNDTAFVLGHRDGSSPAVDLFTAEAGLTGQELTIALDDQPYGAPRAIAVTNSTVVVGSPRPGVWYERVEGEWLRRGKPLFPDMDPPFEEITGPNQIRITPAQAASGAIAAMGDSIVLQAYLRFKVPFSWEDPATSEATESFLGIYSPSGAVLGSVRLPESASYRRLAVVPGTERLLLIVSEPFPQVVEHLLVPFTPRVSLAQQSSCSTDDLAAGLVAYGVELASDTTQRTRDARGYYGVLPAAESEVEHILDERICSRAREAYNAVIDDPDNVASKVVVVRVGTRFIVFDPEYRNPKSEFLPHVVLDEDFKKLAIFVS